MRDRPRRLPRTLYLALAHHYDERLNRTLRLTLFSWEQPLCTRCTAQWLSFAALACAIPFHSFGVHHYVWAAVLLVLPLPALLDWVTQAWRLRESTTAIRLFTGSALGVGYGLELQAMVELDFVKAIIGLGVYFVYMAVLCDFIAL